MSRNQKIAITYKGGAWTSLRKFVQDALERSGQLQGLSDEEKTRRENTVYQRIYQKRRQGVVLTDEVLEQALLTQTNSQLFGDTRHACDVCATTRAGRGGFFVEDGRRSCQKCTRMADTFKEGGSNFEAFQALVRMRRGEDVEVPKPEPTPQPEPPKVRTCSSCGMPEDNHPYRHPFVAMGTA